MDDTNKPSSPDSSTDDAKPGDAPLDDKDLGQEDDGTGDSQDDSGSHDDAPSDDSEDDTEEDPEADDTTSDDEGGEDDEEPTLLTPEEIAKLPPELKAQYVSMNKRFQESQKTANLLVAQARAIIERRGNPADGADDDRPAAPTIVDIVLKRRGIDPSKMKPEARETLDLVAEVAQEAGGAKAKEAVDPLITREVKATVKTYFDQHPERTKFRQDMAKLDQATGGAMTLDQLYFAVAGKSLETTAAERKQKKLRDLSRRNSESPSGGSTAGDGKDVDIFDDIANAGGHHNSILL